ncbi:hypothetical protein JCM10450v2_001586 [Rhodotorula kratochvilovae]
MLGAYFALAALVAGASSVEAFWRLPCGNPLVIERADSIVSPGKVGGHVHNILGGSNFALQHSFEDLRTSECTSCLVKQDMSAYWTPQLYAQYANGSFASVATTGGGLIYYLPRYHKSDTTNVTAFPDGLRMLAGNPFKRSYDSSSPTAQAIGWNCLGANVAATRQPYLPPYDCPNGLRGEIRFPSCWNGKDLDSADHFSHMAYPIGGESGPCPAGYPVRVVTLFYEIMWSVHPWNALRSQMKNPQQPFVLAMGDASGFGYHGDFFNGWDRKVLQEAIDTCTSDTGIIEYCKVFDLYDAGHSCRKTPDVNEIVLGTLAKLPGCNPVTGEGPDVTPCADPSPPAVFANPVAYTGSAPPVGAQVPSSSPSVLTSYTSKNGSVFTYQDCYSDLVSGRVLPNGLSTKTKTVEACLEACDAKSYSYCGVEYHGECWGANTLGTSSTALGAGACGLTCNDNPLQYCGGTGGPGGASMELYTRKAAVKPSSSAVSSAAMMTTTSKVATSTAPSATTTTATTTTTTTAVPTPTQTGKVGYNKGWSYSGCFADLVNGGRSLPVALTGQSNSTVDGCLAAADAAGLAVAGISYYGECWAAPALSPAAGALGAAKCSMKCNGDATQTCGGSGALDVYTSTTRKTVTGPSSKELQTFGAWTYGGCYQDLVNNVRSLPTGLNNANKTVEACLNACTKNGAAVCGLSYYSECWMSKTAIATPLLAESRCGFPCAGNPNEWCGGDAALSVWRSSSTGTEVKRAPFAQRVANTRLARLHERQRA